MELQGKIIAALEQRSGDSKRNPGEKWVSQEFVIEVPGQYPRKMLFNVWGTDRLQRFNIQIGQTYTVSFDIDAREWNGRWFNDIRAYDVRLVDPATLGGTGAAPFAPENAPFAPKANVSQEEPFTNVQTEDSESTDDLPF